MSDTALMAQYFTFTLGSESYALDVSKVREVLEMAHITPLPRAPDYLRGVINVRGSVVPVVDLRLKLGMTRTQETTSTCIVVLDVSTRDGVTVVGGLVDAVQEVVDFDANRVEPPPKMGVGANAVFIKGIARRDDRFVMLLDIHGLFEEKELEELAEAESRAAGPPERPRG
jgi:purine-binding chemotaxis protein CheW